MEEKNLSLLDEAATYMGCQYLSDLHYLTPYQRCVLAAYLERYDAQSFTLFEWNDALEYLSGCNAEDTVSAAKEKLLQTLRKI